MERSAWDPATQEEHGGQSWRLLGKAFVSDFSVTTNGLGTPASGLTAAKDALTWISHYPAANTAHALSALSKFIEWPEDCALVGNGASEFIDLVMQVAPPGPFRLPPPITTYR